MGHGLEHGARQIRSLPSRPLPVSHGRGRARSDYLGKAALCPWIRPPSPILVVAKTISPPSTGVMASRTAGRSIRASNTVSGSHAYADNGVNTVEVCVRIDGGSPGCDTFTVTVNNVAPTATFGNDGPVNEGSSFTLSLSNPTDPGDDSFQYAFDCGDGSGYGAFSTICLRPPAPPQTTGYVWSRPKSRTRMAASASTPKPSLSPMCHPLPPSRPKPR